MVVVGAGPVGLTTAALLAGRGVQVLVVERRTEPHALPRAVHLDDEALRVLQQAGVAERFVPLTRPALGLRLLDAQHRVLAQFDRGAGQHGYPQSNMFDQPDLEAVLRERVAALDDLVEFAEGVELVGLQAGDRPVAVFRRDGRTERLHAAAVLGCDGAGSAVRAAIGARLVDLGRTDRWHVVDVRSDHPLEAWDGVHQVCDPVRPSTFMRTGADRYRFEVRLRDGQSTPRLDELVRPWAVGLAGLEVLRAADYSYRGCVADRWRDRRVLLLGDAAHQSPPFVGQGLGLGLRDAANATWKLAAVLTGAPEQVLASYQQEREPHARSLIRTAGLVGLAMTGGGRGAGWGRAVLLAAADRLPRLSTAALDRGSPSLRPGPLVGRSPAAGRLLPQPRVHGALLDDVLADGWSLVSDGPPPQVLLAGLQPLDVRVLRADLTGEPSLVAWLRRHRTRAVLLRPDRVVAAATDRSGRLRQADRPALARARQWFGR